MVKSHLLPAGPIYWMLEKTEEDRAAIGKQSVKTKKT